MRISLTDRALTIGASDDHVVAWDLGGRLYSVYDGVRTYRRGLNGRVLVKWREQGVRQRAWLSEAESRRLVDDAASLAADVLGGPTRLSALDFGLSDLAGGSERPKANAESATPKAESPKSKAESLAPRAESPKAKAKPDLADVLRRAAAFDARSAAADADAFAVVYRPIGVLPPDQYLALVLQATEGCSFRSPRQPGGGGCTFCSFYREAYRVRTAGEFAEHLSRARAYLGESMRLRARSIFLGSANALAIPMSGLVPIFEVMARELAARPIHAFLDGFTGSMKTAADYRTLGEAGLRRVYIGLESGHDPLLEFVHKPATRAQAIETVRAIKAGGVAAGVIVMIGLGGTTFADRHAADTIDALNEMGLDAGDLLYFSELVDLPGTAYPSSAAEAGIEPLGVEARTAQRQAIAAALTSRPRMATYDVREFVY